MGESFPRLHARTRRFTLGLPRTFTLSPDGSRVLYLRSSSGEDPVHALWCLDVASGEEQLLVDPRALSNSGAHELPPEERARRERLRESGEGIVSYATDRAVTRVVFTLDGMLWLKDVTSTAEPVTLDVGSGVFDARLNPAGTAVAFVRGTGLWVLQLDEGRQSQAQVVAAPQPDEDTVRWGTAEFIAAEEMGRTRGYWWSPDGTQLAVQRNDDSDVQRWFIGDPANPDRPVQELRYPAAGSSNTHVSLWLMDLVGTRTEIVWDRQALPYLTNVIWNEHGPLTIVVQSRDQRLLQTLAVDSRGGTQALHEQRDPHWVELISGVPRWLPDGRLLHAFDDGDTRRLAIADVPITPPGVQVQHVVGVQQGRVLFVGGEEATAATLYALDVDRHELTALSARDGRTDAAVNNELLVTLRRELTQSGVQVQVSRGDKRHAIRSLQAAHGLELNVRLLQLGPQALRAALVLPAGYAVDGAPLPVLLDPYGGPHAQRVVQAADAYLTAQWFADQGFAVLIADGRGSPARGPAWEKTIAGDLATAPLEDQVAALEAAAATHPVLDTSRVAIRGWSFGGYLAALAVLRRPDVFHAAIAGAPVTDWALYDTHYTERYLGTPQEQPDAYRHSSLIDDAAKLSRPLLLIHGLADDNVVAAHTLRLSAALLAAGRAHEVLPLSGVTHMTPQEVVAENLLRLQLDFLQRSLSHGS